MLRSKHFVHLVNETVDEGFQRGIKRFMENLDEQIEHEQITESNGGMENYFNNTLKKAITRDPNPVNLNEGLENVSEDDLDKLLNDYGIK